MGEGSNSEGSFLLIDNTNVSYGGNATISGIRTVGGSGAHYNFVKYQNIDGTKFLINGLGEVAIGGGNTYGYKLAVHGNVRAQEIRVEAGPWPDFVFRPTYPLRSLSRLEKYLSMNRHLPDLPSAKEVKADGINLGDMNSKLLQKIEELTLYVIDLKKENDRQQKEINQLRRYTKTKKR
ncbi:hypothetical protein [Mucilaginibacter sp. PAMB04168]|uniref:hypothetical protein n=1 Tax=Mucilaginibacter sp. PAMB04168 TaxID=3138567 RepID=UPI0031F6C890